MMKITANKFSLTLAVSMLGFATPSHGAVVVVDWLNLAPGGGAQSFLLTADGGLPVVNGTLAIEPGKGIAFPGFPAARTLAGNFWSADTGFEDSVTGDRGIPAFDIRVVPQSSQAVYAVALDIPIGRELILAVGGLHRDALGSTQSIVTSAFSDSGSGAVSLIQSLSWSGGDTFDQELEWDAPSGTLSTTTGSDGESIIAFLRIAPLSGSNSKVLLSIPSGYALGSGDSITIAVGAVVPEPSVFALLGTGAAVFLAGRRRK